MYRSLVFQKLDNLEVPLCRALSAIGQTPLGNLFKVASWLGNGPLWGVVIAALLAYKPNLGQMVLAMTLVNTGLYKALKHFTVRRRPLTHQGVQQGARTLDEFSFPSGHTLHAVGFATMAVLALPALALIFVVLAVLIALSRVVLGLHYPTDVLMGAIIGFANALIFLG